MMSVTARQHAVAFFRKGFGNQLLRMRGAVTHSTWLALCDKEIQKHLSHLRGSDFDDAYESIFTRLIRKAEIKQSDENRPEPPAGASSDTAAQTEKR